MSGQEEFGPLLEVLVTCVGVIDVISLFAFIFNRKNAKESSVDINNNDVRSSRDVRDKTPASDPTRSIPRVVVNDAIAPSMSNNNDVIESLFSKVNELEAKVVELETKSRESSMERFVELERHRRSRSRSPYSQHSDASPKGEESSSYDEETNSSSAADSRENSVKYPPKFITRDDEFRKTIEIPSQKPHESRDEELQELSKIENEEDENTDDFVTITYEGQDDFPDGNQADFLHSDIERSPEPGMSSMVEKPWCDIKKDAADIRKMEKKDQLRRSRSIDEQPAAEEKANRDEKKEHIKITEEKKVAEEEVNDTEKIVEEVAAGDSKKAVEEAEKPLSIVPVNTIKAVDVNEEFIKKEQNLLQQSSAKVPPLVKQAHVMSDEQPDETAEEFEVLPIPTVEVLSEVVNVKSLEVDVSAPDIRQEKPLKGSENSLNSGQTSAASENVRSFRNALFENSIRLFYFRMLQFGRRPRSQK